ncbi:hypothetical protein WICMUC_002814 [Wickerhamomyces mucosus]|uniref:Uncharacterized protein n=1 Tax=Wickerhamomyces mucosus TaxID=1378264 RepID=A0A9P8PN32_9ASCO|nr:hypothetical protein WICMUC_002814 [Wickerhamomyces mucosus]
MIDTFSLRGKYSLRAKFNALDDSLNDSYENPPPTSRISMLKPNARPKSKTSLASLTALTNDPKSFAPDPT